MAYKPRKDIKVSESYIQKLRDTGSKKAALEKYGSSTDPKMREALRRFYGASSITPLGASKRSQLQSLPKKSIPMPKSVSQTKPKGTAGSRGPGPVVQTRRSAAPTTKAPNRAAANRGVTMKSAGAAAAKFNNAVETAIVAAIPAGRLAKGAKAVAGKAISRAKTGSDTAKYYGSAARNMAPRAQKAGEMRGTQQAVAAASKKKASGLQGAATRKANAKAAEKARLARNAKAAATRAKNAKAKAAANRKGKGR
jgi:hypothetical protein